MHGRAGGRDGNRQREGGRVYAGTALPDDVQGQAWAAAGMERPRLGGSEPLVRERLHRRPGEQGEIGDTDGRRRGAVKAALREALHEGMRAGPSSTGWRVPLPAGGLE